MKLRSTKPIYHQFVASVNRNKNTWTKDQQEQLSLIFQILKETHDALVNIVEANQPS